MPRTTRCLALVIGTLSFVGMRVDMATAAPTLVIAESTVPAGGWVNPSRLELLLRISDPAGVDRIGVSLDGVPHHQIVVGCDASCGVPWTGVFQGHTLGTISDGHHTVQLQSRSRDGSASNVGSFNFQADTVPPGKATGIQPIDGTAWRSQNAFGIRWTNPDERSAAPLKWADIEVCPSEVESTGEAVRRAAAARCASIDTPGGGLAVFDGIRVPAPGQWVVRVKLGDAADNAGEWSGFQGYLRHDPSPPASMVFKDVDSGDPTRVRVRAVEDLSGIARGVVEVRRQAGGAWRRLLARIVDGGLVASVDDERLPAGRYELRAAATNGAGLTGATARFENGRAATLQLPLRARAALTAGREGRKRCRRSGGGRRVCARPLRATVRLRAGSRARLHGRLTIVGRAAAARTPIEVWRRVQEPRASWRRIGSARIVRGGRFSYRAPAGPAGQLRFRYAGTSTVRGANASVAMHVGARSTLRTSARSVLNGRHVGFRGTLKGGLIPAGGALVELQVVQRGRWRTFAQTRANARTGRWAYRYRFETVRGRTPFRFRARIRKQANYPFRTGTSPTVRVVVRGR